MRTADGVAARGAGLAADFAGDAFAGAFAAALAFGADAAFLPADALATPVFAARAYGAGTVSSSRCPAKSVGAVRWFQTMTSFSSTFHLRATACKVSPRRTR